MSRSKVVAKSKDEVTYGDQVFTRQECIDDLILTQDAMNEISEEEAAKARKAGKPPRATRVITRNYYRVNGGIPEKVYEALFGTFLEFRRAANLMPTRAVNTMNAQIARAAATDRLHAVMQERLNYGSNYLRESKSRWQTILAFNDLHDEECDPFVRRMIVTAAQRVQPEFIVSNGDHFDVPEFGKYPNDPREWDVVARVRAGLDIFRDLRAASPNSQIDLIEGNHEARVIRVFVEAAPAVRAMLSDLHGMDLKKFLGLDQYGINYVAKADMAGAYTDPNIRQEVRRNFRTYFDTVCAHHFPAGKQFGMAGWNGHHHSHHVQHFYNAMFGAYEWHQFGAGHRRDATYTNGEKWATGFGLIHVDTVAKLCQIEYIHVNTTMCVFAGQLYVRRPEEYYPGLLPMIDKDRVIEFPEPATKPKKG